MQLPFATLDVFTKTPFQGNPVAIIKIPRGGEIGQDRKQLVAREFNLSETVFLHEQTEEDVVAGNVRIDIFTCIAEVPFAGHPTIGTSNYLLRYLKQANANALVTKAGRKPISLTEDGVQVQVAHNVHIHHQPFATRTFGHFPVVSIVKGMTFILARLSTLEELAQQKENLLGVGNTYNSQGALDPAWQEGIVTTYFYVDLGYDADGTRRLRSRMFGSREDPATGSAASALCSFLTLTEPEGGLQRKYLLTQGVEMGRESNIDVDVTLEDDGKKVKNVLLGGSAVKVMEGLIEV